MKVLHAISSMVTGSGGPSTSTLMLLRGLRSHGVDAECITIDHSHSGYPLISDDSFIYTTPPSPKSYLKEWMGREKPDLIHIHGLWEYSPTLAALYAKINNIPYIYSTRGMLYPEGMKSAAWKKKLAINSYQRWLLNGASVVHATCEAESQYNRLQGVISPIVVVPNAIDVGYSSNIRITPSHFKVVFVGRFAPIKNIDILIQAWIQANLPTGAELLLIGDGDKQYVDHLHRLIGGDKSIRVAGFLIGKEKAQELSDASCLILPSKSENFGMVVPEALLQRVPVIASTGTPWEGLVTHHCGWWIDPTVENLTDALAEAVSLSPQTLMEMGERGHRLVTEHYSLEAVGQEMKRVYESVLTLR